MKQILEEYGIGLAIFIVGIAVWNLLGTMLELMGWRRQFMSEIIKEYAEEKIWMNFIERGVKDGPNTGQTL